MKLKRKKGKKKDDSMELKLPYLMYKNLKRVRVSNSKKLRERERERDVSLYFCRLQKINLYCNMKVSIIFIYM